jgi:hypothetical protein
MLNSLSTTPWGVDVEVHVFFISALVGGEWSASRPGRFIPGERAAATHWIGGWVGPRVGQNDVEKRKFLNLPGLELRPLRRPARRRSLYRLRYPGSRRSLSNWKLNETTSEAFITKGIRSLTILRISFIPSTFWHSTYVYELRRNWFGLRKYWT